MSAPSYNILGRFVPKTNGTAGSSTTPPASALVTGELATNSFLGDLFSKKEDGAVALVGANAKQIAGRTITAATPNDGEYLKWDATTGQFVYGTASVSASASAPVLTTFTGNGTQTLFPINGYTNNAQTNYFVSVGGVIQKPDNGTFTVSANGIQLSSAPASGVPGFVLALQAPITSTALGDTTAEEIDRAFRGSDTGVLAIGNSSYYSAVNTDTTIAGCPVTVVSSDVLRISGIVPYATFSSFKRTSGSNILTTSGTGLSGSVPTVMQAARPGHLITGTGIPTGTTIVSVSSTQIVMSANATSSTSTFSASAAIKAFESGVPSVTSTIGFPLALTGFINGVFPISNVNTSGTYAGSVEVFCRSNAANNTTGSVDVQGCSVRSISIGFGAGYDKPVDAVMLGNMASGASPSDTSVYYSTKKLVAIGNEAKAVAYGVAVGAESLAQTSGAVAIGYKAYAGDDVRDYLPYELLICSGTTGTNSLSVNLGNTQGISIGMSVSGTGIPAGTTVSAIPSNLSLTLSANLTSTITNSSVTLSYPALDTTVVTTVSGSPVAKVNDTSIIFGNIGEYVSATQFPAGTRIIDKAIASDNSDILVMSRDATASSTTASVSTKAEGRFRKIITGASVSASSVACTVSSTSGISVGDYYDIYNSDATLVGSGVVARVVSATVFHGSYWNVGAALSSKIIVFSKASGTVAIGYYAQGASGELALCKMNVQGTSGAVAAYLPVNVGGKDYVIPLNARA